MRKHRENHGVAGRIRRKFIYVLLFIITCFHSVLSQAQGWVTLPSPTQNPRGELASCQIGKYIYVLGGANDVAPPSGLNERYDTETNTWTQRRSMPTSRRNLAAVAYDGKCYAIGGENEQVGLQVVEIYDPATNEWTTGSSMPTGRLALTAAVIEDKIYTLGGVEEETFTAEFLKTLEAYDPATDSWESLSPMPTGRGYMASNVLGGKLYAMAGAVAPRTPSDVVEVYDPTSNSWAQAEPMPSALYYPASAAWANKIYVTGGVGFTEQLGLETKSDTLVYDPMLDSWTIGEPLQAARNRHISQASDSKIFVITGARNVTHPHENLGSVEVLQLEESLTINAGLNDAWYNPLTAGQGFFIIVFPVIKQMFLAMFTFDTKRPPEDTPAIFGAADQRWVTAFGGYEGNTAALIIELTTGGRFNDPHADVDQENIGTITVEFEDCSNAIASYDISTIDKSGVIPIQRIVGDNDALCEALLGE